MSISGAIHEAESYFQQLQLRMPFVPTNEKEKIKQLQPGLFSSRDDVGAIYDLEPLLQEALSKKVSNYVLFGMAGRGISSNAMHYYAVSDHLLLFIQADFGNAFRSEQEVHTHVNAMLTTAKMFFERLEKAKGLEADKRLVIVDSDFRGKGWGWIKGFPGKIDSDTWHSTGTLVDALMDIPTD